MCQPKYIRFGPKRYKFMDFLTFLFFNAVHGADQQRFCSDFAVDENGQYAFGGPGYGARGGAEPPTLE